MEKETNQSLPSDKGRLSELLGEELKIYEKIRKITNEQAELLTKDDIEEFNNSLDKREELIEKIKGLHQESEPLMQSYVSFSSLADENKDSTIEGLKKKIRKALEDCAKLNDKNIKAMQNKTEEHAKKIDEQSAKRKGIGGYAQNITSSPEMFDKKT